MLAFNSRTVPRRFVFLIDQVTSVIFNGPPTTNGEYLFENTTGGKRGKWHVSILKLNPIIIIIYTK